MVSGFNPRKPCTLILVLYHYAMLIKAYSYRKSIDWSIAFRPNHLSKRSISSNTEKEKRKKGRTEENREREKKMDMNIARRVQG